MLTKKTTSRTSGLFPLTFSWKSLPVGFATPSTPPVVSSSLLPPLPSSFLRTSSPTFLALLSPSLIIYSSQSQLLCSSWSLSDFASISSFPTLAKSTWQLVFSLITVSAGFQLFLFHAVQWDCSQYPWGFRWVLGVGLPNVAGRAWLLPLLAWRWFGPV